MSTTLNAISLVGIQLESIIVANGFPPYKGDGILTEEKFFLDLANNLKSKQKVVYRPAAEVKFLKFPSHSFFLMICLTLRYLV